MASSSGAGSDNGSLPSHPKPAPNSIAATMASLQEPDIVPHSAQPPAYSEVWSNPSRRASVESQRSDKGDTGAGERGHLLERHITAAPALEPMPTAARPQTVRLALPLGIKSCCDGPRPGDKCYWKSSFRKALRRQPDLDAATLLIQDAVASICGVRALDKHDTVYEIDPSLAEVLERWAWKMTRAGVSQYDLARCTTMQQVARHIAPRSAVVGGGCCGCCCC